MAFAAVFFALVFKTLLDASKAAPKSYPRRWRGISCPLFGHAWLHSCVFDPPASPEDNDFSSYFGHFFQELSSTLAWDFLRLFCWTLQTNPKQIYAKRCSAGASRSVINPAEHALCCSLSRGRLAVICQRSMLKIQDQRRSLPDPPLPPTPIVVPSTPIVSELLNQH